MPIDEVRASTFTRDRVVADGRRWLPMAVLLAVPLLVSGQPSDRLDPEARNVALVASIAGEKGASATVGRITVHVPAGAMTTAEVQALAASLNRAFDGLIAFTHSPRPWQRVPATVDYYFHPELFISHSDEKNDRLFIAFPRLKSGDAPLLHEATHVLLFPNPEYLASHPGLLDENGEGSTWLLEGIASYVAFSVAARTGVTEGDPLNAGPPSEMDARCAKGLVSPVGAEIAPFIGAPGEPAALMSRARRLEVAPLFYDCATSFTKYVAETVGIEAVVDAVWATDSEMQIAAEAGKSMDTLRAEWRGRIGAN
jgi:hypothetical protein